MAVSLPGQPTPLLSAADPLVLAFHLPQFHPIPENDEWWGPGFTEWTNVTRGRPLFRGHYQPHLPADLGFYDLRLPEVRERQATLAREAGLNGFVYYHYWFNGRRLLEQPVNEILRLKQPDFPFCFCWANEPWSRNWDGNESRILMPQQYSDADALAHIEWLLEAFRDGRYIKIDGRPLMLIYRPSHHPDIVRMTEMWREEARRQGFPDLYLCAVRAFPEEFCDAKEFGMDGSIEFKPNGTDCGTGLKSENPLDIGHRLHRVWDYEEMVKYALNLPVPDYTLFPGVCPMWDNSVRRKAGGMIFRDSTPEKYRNWLLDVMTRANLRGSQPNLVFVNAWNEWAEGNHLEPCQRWGHAYLTATREAVEAARQHGQGLARFSRGDVVTPTRDYRVLGNVDRKVRTLWGLQAEGWCADADTLAPPDLLVQAVRQGENRFALLAPLKEQRLPRADVVRVYRSNRSQLSGWRTELEIGPGDPAPADTFIVALRVRDRAAAVLCSLG
jgi:lipopolysaccharide biosynthesis protein